MSLEIAEPSTFASNIYLLKAGFTFVHSNVMQFDAITRDFNNSLCSGRWTTNFIVCISNVYYIIYFFHVYIRV